MSIQWLEDTLSSGFDKGSFLHLAGKITGDKLGDLIEERIALPSTITEHSKPLIFRGSQKGSSSIGIYAVNLHKSTLKSGFKIRRQLANAILNNNDHNDALIAYYADGESRWKLGFVRGYKFDALETLREFQVGEGLAVRTAREQLEPAIDLSDSTEIGERSVALNKAFSVEAISDNFYDQFKKSHFDKIVASIESQGEDKKNAEDLAVLFTIRIIFLGFVQKKRWLADDPNFLQNLIKTYIDRPEQSGFYDHWLKPLFFEALNGFGNHITSSILPDEIKQTYQMLPFLNGGLFHTHTVDNRNYHIADDQIANFFTFLFSYNFTIEENTLQEQSLELNPELLGIIFERLVNKQNGAIYTPRTEVDFMCRISLVKWLQQNLEEDDKPDNRDLFELFFREKGGNKEFDDDQKSGSFSSNQKDNIKRKLMSIAICDPAVGSGAFPVGMMHVLNEVLENFGEDNSDQSRYERKKHIIGRNLYGVEVNEWAVWICQLRLWLSLFIDAPDELRRSTEPILPSLDFKILQGDSLVQTIGETLIPIEGHTAIDSSLKKKVTDLRKLKVDFYNNKLPSNVTVKMIHAAEVELTRAMIIEQRNTKQNNLQLLRQREMISQQSLLGDEPEKVVQQALGDIEEQEYIDEINKIDTMLGNITNKPKTIWSISFAEVFADKGGFDLVIGNPPYVRQESIEDPLNILGEQRYKEALAEVIRQDYFPNIDPIRFKKVSGYNAQSDLCIYFYMHTLKLLNSSGIHTFICSNSWLDVGYGVWMQQFLLNRVQLHGIYDSHGKRSFASADINTIISVLGAPQKKQPAKEYKFIAFKDSYEKGVITENLLAIEDSTGITKKPDYRVYSIMPTDLQELGNDDGKYVGDKWGGKYLRAPDIFFTILKKGKDKLVRTSVVADVRRGFTTGANDFFYLKIRDKQSNGYYLCENGAGWSGQIEQEYLKPVVKSPRECKSILINKSELPTSVFICNRSKEELNNSLALEYIEWGEKHEVRIKQGKNKDKILAGYHCLDTVKGRKYWYALPEQEYPYSSSPMINNNRLINIFNDGVLNDANLVGMYPYNNKFRYDFRLLTSLNSTYNMINWEINGIANLGEGAIKLNALYIKKSIIINPNFIPPDIDSNLFKRKMGSIFQECGIEPESDIPIEEQDPKPLPDRAELDRVVFDIMGLTEGERKDVYRSVCRLVWNRIDKAQSI
jgi:hypothetical protein